MKKEENNQMTMHRNCQSALNENAVQFESIAAYLPAKTKIDESISQEQELANKQEVLKKNSTIAKILAREAAADYILDLASKIMSYALCKGDMTLYEKVKLNKTAIDKSSDNKFVLIMSIELTTAEENLVPLADYNVTAQTISNGKTLLGNFTTEMQKLEDNKIAQKQITVQLNKQLKTTNTLFKPVDAMVETMRKSDPVFYRTYWNSRVVKKTSSTKIAAKGKVFDSVTNLPLPGAIMSIVQYNGNTKLATGCELVKNVKIKSAGGGFQLKSLPTGTYLFKITYAGYTDQESIVYVNEGVLTKVEMPLTKIA